MPRTAARFTRAELVRAAKAMREAGCVVSGARIDREGNIEILCASEVTPKPAADVPATLAEWKERRHARPA